ncbi:hypothetical protein PG994_012812 [Apiospora phragmitis]|uniref:Uncharacterized protein n=1 Tax=Apiospora phragmitis TaxID=2905665 RepID=A0ABR1T6U5_9PEZI
MDIQPPPNVDVSDWPYKKNSRIGLSKYSKPSISKQFLQNKLWSCALLMQHADDCAFAGFDTEGPHCEAPTQIGLAYLPELPTAGHIPPLLGSIKRLQDTLEGCRMICLSMKNGPHDPEHYPLAVRCNYATNATVDESEVQIQLVDLLFEWKMKSKKKFLVLVGFDLSMHIYTLLSQSPVVLNFLDGWVDARELAGEKIDIYSTSVVSKISLWLGARLF